MGLEKFEGDAAAPALFVIGPEDEFALPAAADVALEFAALAAPELFALPFLLAAVELGSPGLDFEFELADDAEVLSRADEEFLLPAVGGLPRSGAAPRLFALREAPDADASGKRESRGRFAAVVDPPPAAEITTSSLLPRCST